MYLFPLAFMLASCGNPKTTNEVTTVVEDTTTTVEVVDTTTTVDTLVVE